MFKKEIWEKNWVEPSASWYTFLILKNLSNYEDNWEKKWAWPPASWYTLEVLKMLTKTKIYGIWGVGVGG